MESLETAARCLKKFLRPTNQAIRKTAADQIQAKAATETRKRKEAVWQTLSNFLKPKGPN